MLKIISRRLFLKIVFFSLSFLLSAKSVLAKITKTPKKIEKSNHNTHKRNKGTDKDGKSTVYYASGYTPELNIKKAIQAMGGIGRFVTQEDIVVLKPNAQWWNHGTTNTNNMKGFIELVLDIPDFTGEIIIAENHHYKELASRGWTTENRNGDFNLYELVDYFNKLGHKNVSNYHWVDGGPNPQPQEGNGGYGNIVKSSEDKDGYVWMEDTVYVSPENRKCMMTYPIFTSSYSGTKIDLKYGSIINGKYKNNIKLINFSCINHHSISFGTTASIKNLMGITDMTCGYHGTTPKGFFNTHFIGTMSRTYQFGTDLKYYGEKFGFGSWMGRKTQKIGYWNSHYTGGSLGYWMNTVKMPDLNILAAEYAGWGGRGRNGPVKRSRTNCVAISTDPVALDYIGVKKILAGATPKDQAKYLHMNSVNYKPFYLFLDECNKQGIGNLDPDKINVVLADKS